MIILDTSIIEVAFPTIQQHFNITQTELQCIFNTYVIAFGIRLLLGRRMSDIFGQKRIFVTGFLVLTASFYFSRNSIIKDILIAARGFQGFGDFKQ